jgi:NAD dependent epimerase/dehydratase
MNWTGKRVLITGAGGFIGSHLAEHLARAGASVSGFVRYNSRGDDGLLQSLPVELRREIRVIFGDLKDGDAVARAIASQQVVFHLGALIGIPYSYVHPMDYVQTNMVGTANVLLACRDTGVERVVHTSTSETYGTALRVPIDESHPLQGQSPYSASKIGADQLAFSFFRSFEMPVAIIRPFNTYGPRQSSRAIIPTIISQSLRGGDVKLGSLTPTRDLTFVSDTVAGFIKVAESTAAVGQVINIGSGREISMGDLAEKIFRLLGVDSRIATDDARVRPQGSEVERLLASTARARELTGWTPAVSLDEGLTRTIAWVRDNLAHYPSQGYQV